MSEENIELMEWEEIKSNNGLWIPEKEGDNLMGEVVEVREGNFGPEWVIKSGGEVFHTPHHVKLVNKMKVVLPTDTVRIIFKGIEKSSQGNAMRMYDVFRGR